MIIVTMKIKIVLMTIVNDYDDDNNKTNNK